MAPARRTVELAATRSAASVRFGALAPLLTVAPGQGIEPVAARTGPAETGSDTAAGADDLRRSILAGCRALATDRPVLVVVDDAPLLDGASMALLGRLVGDPAVRLLLTARTGAGRSRSWSRLAGRRPVEHRELPPLGRGEVAAVLDEHLGAPVGRSVRVHLWHRSQGNPMVLAELVRAGLDRGMLRRVDHQWVLSDPPPVSDHLVEVVEDHLDLLDDDARAGLDLVALGAPLPAGALDRARPGARGRLSAAGLTVAEAGAVTCSHPVWQEVVVARLPPLRRRRRHRELRAALDADRGRPGRPRSGLRDLVWSVEAGEHVPTDHLVRAAGLAAVSDEPVLAERLADLAVHQGGDLGAEVARLDALVGQGRAGEAHQRLDALAEPDGRDDDGVRATIARRAHRLWPAPSPDDAARILERELDRADDPVVAARLSARLVDLHLVRGDAATAVAAAPVLTAPAAPAGPAQGAGPPERPGAGDLAGVDPETRLMALASAASATALAGRAEEALTAVDRVRDLARAHPELAGAARRAGLTRCHALHHAGHLRAAEVEARAGYERSLAEQRFAEAGMWALSLAGRLVGRGRLGPAVAAGGEAVVLLEAHGEEHQLALALAEHALAAALAGRLDVARQRVADHDERIGARPHPHVPVLARARAWLAARDGRRHEAVELLEVAATAARRGGLGPAEAAALTDAARLGAPALVADRLADLARAADGTLVPAVADLAGAAAGGDPVVLDDASIRLAGTGADLVAAEASLLAADLHRRSGNERAASAGTLRAQLLLARCDSADLLGVVPTPEPVVALSERELQIATLATAGATSSAIGEQVFLARRTVDNHLRRVYAALGVRTRTELADVVTGLGLDLA